MTIPSSSFNPNSQASGNAEFTIKNKDGKLAFDGSVTVTARVYEDIKKLITNPIAIFQKSTIRQSDAAAVERATRRERTQREEAEESYQMLSEQKVREKTPPRKYNLQAASSSWSSWLFSGDAHTNALREEERIAAKRLSAHQTNLKAIDDYQAKSKEAARLAEERFALAKQAVENQEKAKTGWFGWL